MDTDFLFIPLSFSPVNGHKESILREQGFCLSLLSESRTGPRLAGATITYRVVPTAGPSKRCPQIGTTVVEATTGAHITVQFFAKEVACAKRSSDYKYIAGRDCDRRFQQA
jgi:hypothetical protein